MWQRGDYALLAGYATSAVPSIAALFLGMAATRALV